MPADDDAFREMMASNGIRSWEIRNYDWCPVCFEKACAEGMSVCHSCAANRPNP